MGEFYTGMTKATRSDINRALAKAIAYRDCGEQAKAEKWAARLVFMLHAENILNTNHTDVDAVFSYENANA